MIVFLLNKLFSSNIPDATSPIEQEPPTQEQSSLMYTAVSYLSLNIVSRQRILYWLVICISFSLGNRFFYTKQALVSFMVQITLLMFLDLILLFLLNVFMIVLAAMSVFYSNTAAKIFKLLRSQFCMLKDSDR